MPMENPDSVMVTVVPAMGINPEQLEFNMRASSQAGTIVLHCNGRLIFRDEAKTLSRTVGRVLPVARRMVIDLSGVRAVDSAGLGELVLLHIWAQKNGYSLKFASPTRELMDLFELTNLVKVFDLHSGVVEAISAMEQ
jgi:anti-sigma B factor antagonist